MTPERGVRASARVRTVTVPTAGGPATLLDDGLSPAQVFTAAEAQLCARRGDLTGWAGRLAAKLAVADLVMTAGASGPAAAAAPAPGHADLLHAIEILPDASACPDPGCNRSHPPAVRLTGAPAAAFPVGTRVAVSISHTARLAVAVAVVATAGRPGTHASIHPTSDQTSDQLTDEGARQ